jgi:hypothetical protein
VTGQSVTDASQNLFANLGWDEVRLPNPVFEGDTIYSRSEWLEKREPRSRPGVGIVRVKTTGSNQDGTPVITFVRTIMAYKKDRAPGVARFIPGELAPDRANVSNTTTRRAAPLTPPTGNDDERRVPRIPLGRRFSESHDAAKTKRPRRCFLFTELQSRRPASERPRRG